MTRRVWKVIGVLGSALTLVLATALPALAHAHSTGVEPKDESTVRPGPVTIRVWIGSDAIPLELNLVDQDGTRYRVDFHQREDGESTVIEGVTESLPRGIYQVQWIAFDTVDGHRSSGGFSFGVDQVDTIETTEPWASPLETGLVWLGLATLMLMIGAVVVWRWMPGPRGFTRHAGRVAAVAGILTLAVWLIEPFIRIPPGPIPAGLALVLETQWGKIWLLRQAFAAITAYLVWRERLRRPSLLLIGAMTLTTYAAAFSGHAADRSGPTIAAMAVHLLASGAWAGGIVTVGTSPAGFLRSPRLPDKATWAAFGRIAAVSAGVVISTGLFQTAEEVGTWRAMFTRFGAILTSKLVLVAIALALAGLNTLQTSAAPLRTRIRNRLHIGDGWGPSRLRTTLLVESLVLLLVIGAASMLSTSEPAVSAKAPTAGLLLDRKVDDLLVTLKLAPDETNVVATITAVGYPRPVAPVEIGDIKATLTDGAGSTRALDLTALIDGSYEVTTSLGEGPWTVRAEVDRPTKPATVAEFSWAASVDQGPGPFALALTAAAIVILALTLWIAQRPSPTPPRPRPAPEERELEELAR